MRSTAQNISISLVASVTSDDGDKIMSYKVEPLPNSVADLGEAPHWDIATQNLYYVDIVNGKLLRYDYNENKVYHCKIENVSVVGFVVPVEGEANQFVVGAERDISIVEWDGFSETCKVVKVLAQVEQGDEIYDGNRFNDGKCDPRGRLYAGTMRYFEITSSSAEENSTSTMEEAWKLSRITLESLMA
uniref:SMP-30/Gluconolactonase/LRE-like region domain-containing protein n=1 Tax=Megaselia scalaris TaxID=36166 RepID=T1H3P8_MEGSC